MMMIFSSLPPVIEIVTVTGAVAVAFMSVVLLLFYCAPTWRKTKEEGKFEEIECEHEHQWTKASVEPGTSTQRIAYYGTLSLSAQNSPTRHLRSISATNPSTHFLSPSHVRSPRRNSSPVAQNQIQIGHHCCSTAANRTTLSPHVLDLNSYPVQPPYWDPESQQYFHCYSYDSTHASPIRSGIKKICSRASPNRAANTMTTSSPAVLKRSSPPHPQSPLATLTSGGGSGVSMTSSFGGASGGGHTPKKGMIDYSNLFLPQPPAPMKNALLDSFNNSPAKSIQQQQHEEEKKQLSRQGKRAAAMDDLDHGQRQQQCGGCGGGGGEEDDSDKDKEDILQVEHIDEKEGGGGGGKFEVILKKKQKMTIPKICSTPPDEEEMKELVEGMVVDTVTFEADNFDEEKMKKKTKTSSSVLRGGGGDGGLVDKKLISGIGADDDDQHQLKEEKHVAEVN